MDWLPDRIGDTELVLVVLAALVLFATEIEDVVRRAFRDVRR